MKKAVCLILAILLLLSVCACSRFTDGGDEDGTVGETEKDKVYDAIEIRRMITEATDKKYTTIGGNSIKRVSIDITNLERVSAKEYIANGTITKTDVYGTKWTNRFDCTITKHEGDEWSAGSFEYKDDHWTKE